MEYKGHLVAEEHPGSEGLIWMFRDKNYIKLIALANPFVGQEVYWDGDHQRRGHITDLLDGFMIQVQWDDSKEPEEMLAGELLMDAEIPEGLHLVKNGDYLVIYDRYEPEKVVWEGEVKMKAFPAFTEQALDNWIHCEQEGVARDDWAMWFIYHYPAVLRTKAA